MLQVVRLMLLSSFVAASGLAVAGGPVTWAFSAVPQHADTVQLKLQSTCEAGWHIYALSLPSDEGPLPTVVNVLDGPAFKLAGRMAEPEPVQKEDPAFGILVRYHEGRTTFTQNIVRGSVGPFTVQGSVEFMACNDKTCLPPTRLEFTLDIPPAQLK